MAPRVKIAIKNCTKEETIKNVNDWFIKEVDLSNIGVRNFSAYIKEQCLTISWEHPNNSSFVYDLLIPVLEVIKSHETTEPKELLHCRGVIDSTVEFSDYTNILKKKDPTDSSLYPYSYEIISLSVNLNNLIIKPKHIVEDEE